MRRSKTVNGRAAGPQEWQPVRDGLNNFHAGRRSSKQCRLVRLGLPDSRHSQLFGEAAWCSARRTPPYYPDAITVRPDATLTDFLPDIDTASPECSIKDSFAALDLTSDGFIELFTAQWIHRRAGLPAPEEPALRTKQVSTAAELRDWQAAWHGDDATPDVFRPALLDDPSVRILAVDDGECLAGGVVLHCSSEVVGLSNVFAVDSSNAPAVWSAAITVAANHFPGHPLVGYERGDGLALAFASGFVALGALRVWVHRS
jgi:hypothetical protein